MVLLWVAIGLAGVYFWLRGWWFAVLIGAICGAVAGLGVVVLCYDSRPGIQHIGWSAFAAICGMIVGSAPWWIRRRAALTHVTRGRARDAAFESFGKRLLNDLAPPTGRRD
jgi:hypothetical protein